MQYNVLGKTDLKVSHVSLGGAAFSNYYGSFQEDLFVELIRESIKCGINYMETGPWYGQGSSEKTFGKALLGIPRDSYVIASKVGRYEQDVRKMFDYSAEKTEFGVDNTLKLLGLDYVDIIQIHDCSITSELPVIFKETLPTLERAIRDGKARYIGLADYDVELMKEIVEESEIKISSILSYSKSTFFDNRLQNYTSYFKEKGVGVINAAATGMGLLCNSGPQPWHPASDELKNLCRQAAEYCKEQNVELARLATWFSLNQPGLDTTICGFYNIDQLKDTKDLINNGLTERELNVYREMLSRFFKDVTQHWDGVDIQKHKKKMEAILKQ